MKKSVEIFVTGLVQGVGFRPFVYRIAAVLGLNGTVENRNDGVKIRIEGSENQIDDFVLALKNEAPPASSIRSLQLAEVDWQGFADFSIVKSENISEEITEISPDIAVCNDCLTDMKIQEHRIDYPFINCTNCGPRFTIIQDLPYDRDKTTMDKFMMCNTCHQEYTNIMDRRFHAQPIACNHCGPEYELHYQGDKLNKFKEICDFCAALIDEGQVLAMKGLGGFHLACDALNATAVRRLRDLKHRESKPLAIMFRNIQLLKEVAYINEDEEHTLLSWRRPIVILKLKTDFAIPDEVSNGLKTLGVMLPYLPFHHLLFEKLQTNAIVLTSGNISDEPIVIDNQLAIGKLAPISDALLLYNRDIYNRTDDSVVFVSGGKERIIRRSRGYVPNPVLLNFNAEGIFAAGAELKNCFCIGKGRQAILSQHIGDLKNISTYDFYTQTATQFLKLFRLKPSVIVADLHPDYLSTRFAEKLNVPVISVQHHHAHVASCMAEHGLDENVIGISFDGTGYGDDGNTWGGEFFICDFERYKRIYHFEYVPVPGGDKASEEAWRMAVSYLYKVYGPSFAELKLPLFTQISPDKVKLLVQAIDKNINTPLTSSAGRLFDAVSALTGICTRNNFEAEAPMRLEAAIKMGVSEFYPHSVKNENICFDDTIKSIVEDVLRLTDSGIIAAKFHNTIVNIIQTIAEKARTSFQINKVVMSGGVFQNRYLLENAEKVLTDAGFEVFTQTLVPSNDGGIALGQLAVAARKFVKSESL
ncbi:MAG: carbamoyltransferase HypF [Bacteroidota bacterium]